MVTLSLADGSSVSVLDGPPWIGGEALVYRARLGDVPCVVKVAKYTEGRALEGERAWLEALGADPATAPRVPRLLGHGQWDGRPFLVLEEFADTAAGVVERGLPLAARRNLAARIARDFDALVSLRPDLVHGDLKPSNVLLDGERLVFADFGATRSRRLPRSTTTFRALTPSYAPPEQSLPFVAPDPSWDRFGLAATVYHVLVGRPAEALGANHWRLTDRGRAVRLGSDDGGALSEQYLDYGAMEVLTASDRAALDAVVQGPIRAALLRALQPDPRRRSGSPAELARALDASRDPRPPGSRRVRGQVGVGAVVAAVAATTMARSQEPLDYPLVEVPGADGRPAVWLGRTEVDQRLWAAVMGSGLASRRKVEWEGLGPRCPTYEDVVLEGPDLPMVCVDFLDTVRFANALSLRNGREPAYTWFADPRTGRYEVSLDPRADGYRLPTLAEWRQALGAPTDPCRENVADRGFGAHFPGAPHEACDDGFVGPNPVGWFPPRPSGVHDLQGNVTEWLWDPGGPGRRFAAGGQWSVVQPLADHGRAGPTPDHFRAQTLGFRLAAGGPP